MTTKGKSFRKRQWWLTGDDELAAYYRKVGVWISSRHSIPKNLLDDLESLLNSSSVKDVPHNGAEGIYWEGTEAGLIGIPLFDIRNGRLAREGQYGSVLRLRERCMPRRVSLCWRTNLPHLVLPCRTLPFRLHVCFYRHEGETGGFCRMGRDEEGSSYNRVEHAAACIALEDAIAYAGSKRPLILLTDSNCLLMAIQK